MLPPIRRIMLAVAVAALALVAGPAGRARAGQALSLDNTTGYSLANGAYTLGFSFSMTQDSVITQLGLFDDGQDGLVEAHDIGLWDDMGQLLYRTTIDGGETDPLIGQFRYIDTPRLFLSAGKSYSVGAFYGESSQDALIFPGDAANFATAPEVLFGAAAFAPGSDLAFPAAGLDDVAYFGPNFSFEVVPEPATVVSGGTAALVGLGLAWRRRRARPPAGRP